MIAIHHGDRDGEGRRSGGGGIGDGGDGVGDVVAAATTHGRRLVVASPWMSSFSIFL